MRIAQPDMLLSPEMVARLQLSPAQQLQLQRVVLELRTADRPVGSPNEYDIAQLTLGRRSLSILTHEQRKLLEAWQKTQPDGNQPDGSDKPSDNNGAADVAAPTSGASARPASSGDAA
jgi:hypothetical protein